jgi:hypothetical protein
MSAEHRFEATEVRHALSHHLAEELATRPVALANRAIE